MKKPQKIFIHKAADNAAIILLIIAVVSIIVMLVVIVKQHHERVPNSSKVVTITGFQDPLMDGYSFLDTAAKDKIFRMGPDKVDVRQDLGVKATITTYRDGHTHTIESADVWMWKMVQ